MFEFVPLVIILGLIGGLFYWQGPLIAGLVLLGLVTVFILLLIIVHYIDKRSK